MNKTFAVFYRLELHGNQTGWHRLIMEHPYGDKISASTLLEATHWRLGDISRAVRRLESDVCKMIEIKIVELK